MTKFSSSRFCCTQRRKPAKLKMASCAASRENREVLNLLPSIHLLENLDYAN